MTTTNNEVTSDNLGENIFEAIQTSFGEKFGAVKKFVAVESEKLAVTLRMIIESSANGEVSQDEAEILLKQQKLASSAVLAAAEGMTDTAVQAAINAALTVVKDFVNSKTGFQLI